MAYKYVSENNKEYLHRAQAACTGDVKALEALLKEEEDISSQFFSVGSARKNMVTQNGKGNFDFDFNLNVFNAMELYEAKYLRDTVRHYFNEVMNDQGMQDVNDSTSVLSTKLMKFDNFEGPAFKIDLAIVTKRDDEWYRLKYDKVSNQYIWNKAPKSKGLDEKVRIIKESGIWEDVRKRYLELKNHYLRIQDNDHPSFICYIEAVNEVYNNNF